MYLGTKIFYRKNKSILRECNDQNELFFKMKYTDK